METLTDQSRTVQFVPWETFMANWSWKQGEHVTLIGPTGIGKTTLINAILPEREYIVFLRTKQMDQTQDQLSGYRVAHSADELHPDISHKWIVRPRHPSRKGIAADRYAKVLKEKYASLFAATLMRIHDEGGWTVVIDEARVITGLLGLSDEAVWLWTQGRSNGNTVVAGTQRPRHIPLEAYDQPVHLFFFRDSDTSNVKRVAEMAGIDGRLTMRTVPNLPKFHVLYVNTRTGEMVTTKVDT